MILVGLSWLVYWLLVDVFTVENLKAALATAIIFIVLALLVEGSGINLSVFKKN